MNFHYLKNNWEYLSLQSKDHFKSSTLLQHHAVQFIAMAGRYLVPQKKDDGNTSMKWHPNKRMLMGQWIDTDVSPVKLGIRIDDLTLFIFDTSYSEIDRCSLQGNTKAEVFEWLRKRMIDLGQHQGPLEMDMHYSIKPHKTDDGYPFEIENKAELQEISSIRMDADLLIHELARQFERPSKIRIWPHHFDTNCVIPVENRGDHLTKTIAIGLGVPDVNVDYYYFYVTHWTSDDDIDYFQANNIDAGGHWITNSWIGAVLSLSELHKDKDKESQVDRAYSFFYSAINNTLELLKSDSLKMK
jgi:hypothetical protein